MMHSVLARAFTRRSLKLSLLGLAILLALWLFASWAVAYRLTRRYQAPFLEMIPAVAWGKIEESRLRTCDGQEIGAWFIAGRETGPSVVLLHGNGECRGSCLPQAELLAAAQYPVLMITHRGHGDSTGEVNDLGFSARHDVVAAVDWLERRRPGKPIVVFGSSLGAAAAVFAASDLQQRVGGYILECPYQDLKTAVRNRTAIYLPPVADWVAYTGLEVVAPLVLSNVEMISPLEAVTQIPQDVPILIMAGGSDRHATLDEARAFYKRVNTHSQLVIFDGATHLRLFETDPQLYRRSLLDFLEKIGRHE